jgi:predicted DNA-binding transcriptional regulator AlpA
MEITFEQLPRAVTLLCEDIAFIKRHLIERAADNKPEVDRWFNLSQLCEYLPDRPAKATIYGKVSANTIPCHKDSKKLRFLKSEIDLWLLQGRKKTLTELEEEADGYLGSLKLKGGAK